MESVMKRTTATGFLSTCAISLALFSSCTSVEPNTLTPEEIADGWQLLFDGKTLNGWKDYNGTTLTQPWHVVDGCIQAKGDGSDASGYIVTDKQYENFELSWDWKLSKGGNSGMLYHVVERPQFAVPYVTGPEYQLIDEPNFPEPLEEWQKLGVDYAMHLPDKAKMKVNPQGEWNNSKIVFDNGHVEHWLNGVKILEFEAWTDDWYAKKNSGKWANAPEYGLAKKGVLCLQDHGYPASFRNIKIKELPRKTKEVTLFNGTDLKEWEAYGTEKWYVEDGLLICESGPDKKYGYLATRDYYDDFDLTVEFKQEADGNSGVFIRSFIEEDVKVNGWQVEVAPKGHDTGGIYESYGRGWLIQIPDEKENILKEGDWNTMRIKVQGDNVQTWRRYQGSLEKPESKNIINSCPIKNDSRSKQYETGVVFSFLATMSFTRRLGALLFEILFILILRQYLFHLRIPIIPQAHHLFAHLPTIQIGLFSFRFHLISELSFHFTEICRLFLIQFQISNHFFTTLCRITSFFCTSFAILGKNRNRTDQENQTQSYYLLHKLITCY